MRVADESAWRSAVRVGNSPLYVVPWDPTQYQIGVYGIEVIATDGQNNQKHVRQQFATREAEVPTFSIIRRLVLMSKLGKFFLVTTVSIALALLLFLFLLRYNVARYSVATLVHGILGDSAPIGIIRDFRTILLQNWVFWPLVISTVYTMTSTLKTPLTH